MIVDEIDHELTEILKSLELKYAHQSKFVRRRGRHTAADVSDPLICDKHAVAHGMDGISEIDDCLIGRGDLCTRACECRRILREEILVFVVIGCRMSQGLNALGSCCVDDEHGADQNEREDAHSCRQMLTAKSVPIVRWWVGRKEIQVDHI